MVPQRSCGRQMKARKELLHAVLRAVCVNAGGIMSTQQVQCDDETGEQKYMNINGKEPQSNHDVAERNFVMQRERYVTFTQICICPTRSGCLGMNVMRSKVLERGATL